MENALEKLRWLDYEKHFVRTLRQRRVGKDEFIVPARNPGLQFNLYIQLLKWLLTQIEVTNDEEVENEEEDRDATISEFQNVDTFDDPNLIAQKLMLVLRCLRYEIDFPITKLKQPYGGEAISILNFLADRALDSQTFQHKEPQYVTLDKLKSAELDEQQDDEELISTDDETFEDSNDSIDLPYEITTVDNDKAASQMNTTPGNKYNDDGGEEESNSKFDQRRLWKEEVQRVAPALEVVFDNDEQIIKSQNDWRTIINNALKDHANVTLEMKRSKEAFERLSKESNRSLELIEAKEQMVNEKYSPLIDEYKHEVVKIKKLQKAHDESFAMVNDLREELNSICKKVDEVKAKVDEKGNRMTDTSPLIQIKTTLKDMKVEIREYDLQIGVLEHNLLQRRLLDSKTTANGAN